MVIPLGCRLVTRGTGLLRAPCVKEPTHLKPEWKVKDPPRDLQTPEKAVFGGGG